MPSTILVRAADVRRAFEAAQRRDVTISEVARAIGITRAALGRIEHGQVWPTRPVLAALCNFYGVQPGEMLELVEE